MVIAAINSRVKKQTHRFGLELPTLAEHAHHIVAANGNSHCHVTIVNDMYNILIVFKILEDSVLLSVGWKKSIGHLVFDIKMYFTCNAISI